MPYTIETDGLRKALGATTVLDGLDLAVEGGSVFALLGPNGAGKTTTVRILSTLLRPDGGSARVAGHDVAADPAAVRAAISVTGQCAAVDDLLTGEENLVLMGRLHRLGRAGARRRADELLERFDLVGARGHRVGTYSGGMRRRLDLAVSLIARPAVVFLDEPTTGLDPRSRRAVWSSVAELCAEGVTILLTTQYLEEADRLADRIAVLDGGRVAALGTAEELKRRLAGEAVELEFASPDAVRRAGGVLGSPGAAALAVDETALRVRIPTDGSADEVHRLLGILAGAGIHVERVAVHRPTLDDVFLSLTAEESA